MSSENCYDILKEMEDDFEQLHAHVMRTQHSIESWQLGHRPTTSGWFDIAKEMLELLTELSRLTALLYKANQAELNGDQLKILAIWERVIAIALCFIQWFTQLDDESNKKDLVYQFYFDAHYELRTPFGLLRGYSNLLKSTLEDQSSSEQVKNFVKNVMSQPFVPTHTNTLVQIDHYSEQLWKFMDTAIAQIAKGRNDES